MFYPTMRYTITETATRYRHVRAETDSAACAQYWAENPKIRVFDTVENKQLVPTQQPEKEIVNG